MEAVLKVLPLKNEIIIISIEKITKKSIRTYWHAAF